MNEEIKKKLEENAVGLLEFVEKSKDFVLEQAPLYVQELVAFHFISNAATLTGILIFFFTVLIFFIKSFKYGLKHEFEDHPNHLLHARDRFNFRKQGGEDRATAHGEKGG